jgi:hypothetical protein
MTNKLATIIILLLLALVLSSGASADFTLSSVIPAPELAPIGTTFTYQGSLIDGGSPANGAYDFEFKLFNDATVGTQVGGTESKGDVTVSEGIFTVELDFGDFFNGTAYWLEIWVRLGASTGGYQQLLPRQPLTTVPYASYAANAPWSGLSGVPAGFADGVDDDTTYQAGFGLEKISGQFEIDVNETQTRVDHICPGETAMRIIASDGSALCEPVGSGDIEGVTAGTGLTGGGDTGSVTLNANTTYLQRRVGSTCAAGSSIRTINADGTVVCESDNDTTFVPSVSTPYFEKIYIDECTGGCTRTTLMTPTGNSFCYLTRVEFVETDSVAEWAGCNVNISGSLWTLETRKGGGDVTVTCAARCISW